MDMAERIRMSGSKMLAKWAEQWMSAEGHPWVAVVGRE